jgi:hypothetical protein
MKTVRSFIMTRLTPRGIETMICTCSTAELLHMLCDGWLTPSREDRGFYDSPPDKPKDYA